MDLFQCKIFPTEVFKIKKVFFVKHCLVHQTIQLLNLSLTNKIKDLVLLDINNNDI